MKSTRGKGEIQLYTNTFKREWMVRLIWIVTFLFYSNTAWGTETYKDMFDVQSYSNSNGSLDWRDYPWIETNDDDDPVNGQIEIQNDQLYIHRISSDMSIAREVNLSIPFATVTLTFDFDNSEMDDEVLNVDIYDGSDWSTVGTIDKDSTSPFHYVLSDTQKSANTQIRFSSGSNSWDIHNFPSFIDDEIYIDNIQFELFIDRDSDGVEDNDDIDDDNDGILDIQECTSIVYDAYWPLDNNSTDDTSGNGHDLQKGTVGFSSDTIQGNSSGDFNGTDDYLQYSDGTFLNQEFTYTSYAMWVKADKLSGVQTILDEGGSWNGIAIRLNGDTLEYAVREKDDSIISYTQSPFTFPNDNAWHHIALTYNDGKMILYLDGIASPEFDSGFGTLNEHPNAQGFGRTNGSDAFKSGNNDDYFDGLMDDIRHYYAVLTPKDVESLYRKCDSDGDGVPNYFDLDSDNDGIPDNIEAQDTSSYISPSPSFTDSDHDGLDDVYDQDSSGAENSRGLIPFDKDHDHIPDFMDSDSDNDGYNDCEEGLDTNIFNIGCPVTTSEVGVNGLSDNVENSDDYNDTNGNIDHPASDLMNETGDTKEVAYREFLCGKALTTLTSYQWKLISIPCNTGSLTVDDIFGFIGTYEVNYVLYKQSGSDNYEVNETEGSSHKNTDKIKLDGTDTLEQGISYWIITDHNVTVTIDKTLVDLTPTATEDNNSSNIDINDTDFEKVHRFTLPDNAMNHTGWVKKYMAGNPFPYAFDIGNLYFSHGGTSGSYNPMGDSSNDDYIDAVFYKHDSSDTSDKNISSGGGYVAVSAGTPGFDNGGIKAMEGFFIKLPEVQDTDANYFAYPLMIQNGSGN